jgi:quercetin dioxygenase-like cupin family protein
MKLSRRYLPFLLPRWLSHRPPRRYTVGLHENELPAGQSPHPPHSHLHEEMLLVREGVMEVTVNGRATRLGPGSVAYLSSNQEHGYRNAGTKPATYFVLAPGSDQS